MQESFLDPEILIKIILIKNLNINHGFAFEEIQEVSKKIYAINAQCNINWASLWFRKLHPL